MVETLLEDLAEARPVLASFIGEEEPLCGIVLGSGLNSFAERLEDARFLPFCDVPHLKVATATGHKGRFALGRLPGSGRSVLCMQGRLHGYEGNTPQEVAFPIWLMHQAGIGILITTNAAGAINPSFRVGDFCLMTDQMNLTGRNPLVGVQPDILAARFVPMLDAFDPRLADIARAVARESGIGLSEGVYLGLLGPSFETPAEIRAFAALGADTVAMSVVEEVIAARHAGMRVLGISMLANMACGVAGGDPSDAEVHETAAACADDFEQLIFGIVEAL